MATVVLGNTAPLQAVKPDESTDAVETYPAEIDNGREDNYTETTFIVPGDTSLAEAVTTINTVWSSHHSADPPAWVESGDDPLLAEMLARNFSTTEHECTVGRPEDWPSDYTDPEELRKAAAEARQGFRAPRQDSQEEDE